MFFCHNLKVVCQLPLHFKEIFILNVLKFSKSINRITNMSTESSNSIIERKSEIFVKTGSSVFYNPVQEFNRDLSVLVLNMCMQKYFGESKNLKEKDVNDGNLDEGEKKTTKPVRVLEALSATGLRSIRYAKEVPGLTEIIANDISAAAAEIIKANILHNGVSDLVRVSHSDAKDIMFSSRHPHLRFDIVDLDPYGCPSQFLDSAVQAVTDGGLLLVTCTDMAVLCGATPETCYVKYGAISLRNKACHEMALRIVLQTIESHANRYKRYIVPLLSISADFYVRVFVRVFTSAVECKNTLSKLSLVFQCTGCETITLQPLGSSKRRTGADGMKIPPKYILPTAPSIDICKHCGSKSHMGGPIWSAPIHDAGFVSDLALAVDKNTFEPFGTQKRLEGVLNVIREELHHVPLYYSMDRLFSVVHATSMSMMTFRSALLNAGYKVSYSHASKTSIKTTAPVSVVWDIVRAWVALHPVSEKKLAANAAAAKLLATPCEVPVDFSLRRDANPLSREMKLVRYQENPTPFWGPGTRSIINVEQTKKLPNKKTGKKRKRYFTPGPFIEGQCNKVVVHATEK